MEKKICSIPFKKIEIDSFGDVYTCCPCYINNNKIGNIFDENITSVFDIWNSKQAVELRQKLINADYSLCNLDICKEMELVPAEDFDYSICPPTHIQIVTLAYDKECNIQCITCRDKKIKNDNEQNNLYNQKIIPKLMPLLEHAKEIKINGSGEAFYSKHCRLLIKELTSRNKTAKFTVYTNGILFNEANCKLLGLTDRINNVSVSVHALNPQLYNKIMIGSNLEVVLKNLNWISSQHKTGKIKYAAINSVISDMNYTEMPKLVKLAQELDLYIVFSIYCPWGSSLDADYKELTVWEKTHKNHENLKSVLKEVRELNYNKCQLSPAFKDL